MAPTAKTLSAAKQHLANLSNASRVGGATPKQAKALVRMLLLGMTDEQRSNLHDWVASAQSEANTTAARAAVDAWAEAQEITTRAGRPNDGFLYGELSLAENKFGQPTLAGGLLPYVAFMAHLAETEGITDPSKALGHKKGTKALTRLLSLGVSRATIAEAIPTLAPAVRGTRSRGGRVNMSGGGTMDMSAGNSQHNMASLPAQPQGYDVATLIAALQGVVGDAATLAVVSAQPTNVAELIDSLKAVDVEAEAILAAVSAQS